MCAKIGVFAAPAIPTKSASLVGLSRVRECLQQRQPTLVKTRRTRFLHRRGNGEKNSRKVAGPTSDEAIEQGSINTLLSLTTIMAASAPASSMHGWDAER
jgi:hypothetical protein